MAAGDVPSGRHHEGAGHNDGAADGYSRVTELEAWGPAGGGAAFSWLVSDHLGTPRIVADESGDLAGEHGVKRHDYLLFGEEIGIRMGMNDGTGFSQGAERHSQQ